jgi:hypothetical protein
MSIEIKPAACRIVPVKIKIAATKKREFFDFFSKIFRSGYHFLQWGGLAGRFAG